MRFANSSLLLKYGVVPTAFSGWHIFPVVQKARLEREHIIQRSLASVYLNRPTKNRVVDSRLTRNAESIGNDLQNGITLRTGILEAVAKE